MSTNKATILITTRNRAKQLRHGLESIRARDYKDTEILVVDDASIDETPEILRSYNSFVRVERIERKGGYRRNPGRVLNLGHFLVRSDVVIEQGGEMCHLTDCVSPLLDHCRPGIVALARVYGGDPNQMALLSKDIEIGQHKFPQDAEIEIKNTRGDDLVAPRLEHEIQLYCGVERPVPFLFLGAIHKRDFDSVGGYDENRLNRADEDLANRLLAKGVKFRFVGKAVAFHLKHGKS